MASDKTEVEKLVPTPMQGKADPVGSFILSALAVFSKLELTPAAVGQNVRDMVLWRRVGAAVIDIVVLFCFFKLANSIVLGGKNLTVILNPSTFWVDALSVITPLLSIKPVVIMFFGGVPLEYDTFFFSPIFATMVILLYHALLESSPWQGSLGKKICGVVVSDTYGHRISFARAVKRNAAKSITFLPYFVIRLITFNSTWVLPLFIYDVMAVLSCGGFAVALASLNRQCIHDAVADTLVLAEKQAERVKKAGPPVEELRAPLGKKTLDSMTPPRAETKDTAESNVKVEAASAIPTSEATDSEPPRETFIWDPTEEPVEEAAKTLTFESLDPGATQPISPAMAEKLAREAAEEASRGQSVPTEVKVLPVETVAPPELVESVEQDDIEAEEPPSTQSPSMPGEDMKECPACAEWIKAKAKKCRYCQERFE